MIILNIDLAKDIENDFYKRAREENLSYLQYVEELIKKDIENSKKNKKEEEKPSTFPLS